MLHQHHNYIVNQPLLPLVVTLIIIQWFSSVPPLRSCMVIMVSCSPTVMRCWSGLLATLRRITLGQVVQPPKMSCWKKVYTGTSFQHMLLSPFITSCNARCHTVLFFTQSGCLELCTTPPPPPLRLSIFSSKYQKVFMLTSPFLLER